MEYRGSRETIGDLQCAIISPHDASGNPIPPTALGVFCHGYGAGGDDLVGLAGELLGTVATDQPIALAFPAAPIDLTDQGMPGGRAWWPLSIQRLLAAMEEGLYEQIRMEVPEGIDTARAQLTTTIELLLERYKLPASKLLMAGFSQGAMLSMDAACIGLAQPPASLCLYSAALLCEKQWKASVDRLSETNILQTHGRFDTILPLQTGIWLRELLEVSGGSLEFMEFDGPHTIPSEAITHTASMLSQLAS